MIQVFGELISRFNERILTQKISWKFKDQIRTTPLKTHSVASNLAVSEGYSSKVW